METLKADFISKMMKFKADFVLNFIESNRWRFIVNGLKTTLTITFFSAIIGVVLGFVVAMIRYTYDTTKNKHMNPVARLFVNVMNFFCKIYLTVIRGTPVVVQLMIIYFVVFGSTDINKVIVAIIAFSINSGAYVAEIVRGGLMSIDFGQMEAGRSLGFNYVQTIVHIIMPQAFKNVLPALANEVIVLLKETSVCGYIALEDLTKGGDIIRGRTFNAFMPLFAVAIIYLIMVILLTFGQNKLERRLSKNAR